MNMFKKSRKAKEQPEVYADVPSIPNHVPAPAKSSKSLRRIKKKELVEEEEKPMFDLASALPDTNDFRTSLMMPTLSARFSMLREQNDPATKIGKASDDSVLFPKRASRLNLFNNHQLTDIAEVESIYSSFRPPFADENRAGSVCDGYASDDGGSSIMSRSRPPMGNILFSGQQKFFKIPNSSKRDFSGESVSSNKQQVYHDDVAPTMFHRPRPRDREPMYIEDKAERSSLPTTEAGDVDHIQSPTGTSNMSFSRNRGTQSSTNSAPSNGRSSTAATSVVSDTPINRQSSSGNGSVTAVKSADQTTNASVENVGLVGSPTFRKVRDDLNKPSYQLSPSRSAANLRENITRPAPAFNVNALRAMNPPLSAELQPLDFGLKDTIVSPRFEPTAPVVPNDSNEADAVIYNNSVQPNDRGKATALGLFHRPQKTYDEQQFTQRQIQLHEGRISPHSLNSRSASSASTEQNIASRYRSGSVHAVESPTPTDQDHAPEVPPMPIASSPMSATRISSASSISTSKTRSRSKSSASMSAAAVKARVESLIKHQNEELEALAEDQIGRDSSVSFEPIPESPSHQDAKDIGKGTFFDNADMSEDEMTVSSKAARRQGITSPMLPSDVHPALRISENDFVFDTEPVVQTNGARESEYSQFSDARSFQEEQGDKALRSSSSAFDSTKSDLSPLPQITGLGLSSMIRAHLRHDSDRSSIMPLPSPPLPRVVSEVSGADSTVSASGTVTESIRSDPFEFDTSRLHPQPSQEFRPPTPTTAMSQRAQEILNIATAIKNANQADLQAKEVADALSHQRNESTETQKEQQRFDEELAERRRRVQEGLKSVNERSRSGSPILGTSEVAPRSQSTSRSMSRGADSQTKAMRMLGLGSGSREQSSPRIPFEQWREEERSEDLPFRHPYRNHPSDSTHPMERRTPSYGRHYRQEPDHGNQAHPPRSTTPSGRRERSDSRASSEGSRNRMRYRNEPEPPMPQPRLMQFNSNSPPHGQRYQANSPYGFRGDERSASAMSNGYRERPGYLSPRGAAPPEMPHGFTPRHSPNMANSPQGPTFNMPLSPPVSALPSPNPGYQGQSSGRATPTQNGRITPPSMRKKSITKGMISEPTFLSSTSSVPLVHLPQGGAAPPAVPLLSPKRRGTAGEASSPVFLHDGGLRVPLPPRSVSNQLPEYVAGPVQLEYQPQSTSTSFRPRHKLRKSSSEGGNLAAIAREHASMSDMRRGNDRSPAVPAFPNRSTTALGIEGGMF